ncbi:MAG: hypothetical protein NTZ56_01225 [Acidobacteria bacterium]|nr:hypothetical protein [Acidobacteriota bacterium]
MGLAIVRYAAALMIMAYGFAKVNGSQFTILDSELDKPMGHVSGFWLTWYYFGFSKVYGNLIAFAQIGGALLLTFRRTTLLGACLLAPILANIVLIDIFYGVEPGATLVALILFCVVVGLIGLHFKDLVELFWTRQKTNGRVRFAGASVVKWTLRMAMVSAAFGFTYWVANYNNRAPSPIDGTWEVVRAEPSGATAAIPQRIYFEYNRAYMSVFKFANGSSVTHHFQANPDSHSLDIWQKWLSKGAKIFTGTYVLDGTRLVLRGELENLGKIALELEKRQVR